MVFFQKLTGDAWKTLYFCRFEFFFALALLALSFLYWPFLLLVFWFFHFLYFFWLLFHKSSFNVLVIVYFVLGFLGFVMCYLLFFFWGGGLKCLRAKWGGPKSHLTWNPPYLFYFVFCSRARKPWSAHCELKHWNFGGWKCLIHGLHFTV